MNKKVIVLGASTKKERYSNKLINQLLSKGFHPIPIGRSKGYIGEVSIKTELPKENDFYAISIYLNPKNQEEYKDFILQANTEKIIFNPGSENPEFLKLLKENNKPVEEACSLVQIGLGIF